MLLRSSHFRLRLKCSGSPHTRISRFYKQLRDIGSDTTVCAGERVLGEGWDCLTSTNGPSAGVPKTYCFKTFYFEWILLRIFHE